MYTYNIKYERFFHQCASCLSLENVRICVNVRHLYNHKQQRIHWHMKFLTKYGKIICFYMFIYFILNIQVFIF